MVAAQIGGSIGKKLGKASQKGVSKTVKAEKKATKNLLKQTNKFNKATNGGRNLTQAAVNNLSKAKVVSKVARSKTVRAQMVNMATRGAAGMTTSGAAQNVAKDKTKPKTL